MRILSKNIVVKNKPLLKLMLASFMLCLLVAELTACGQSGPLYLPVKKTTSGTAQSTSSGT